MEDIIKTLCTPAKKSRKGDNGRLLIIGGSRLYHGAPVFSLIAARRFVDLLYFYPGEKDAYLINAVKRIPEVIVVDDLNNIADADAVLFGIGMGNAALKYPDILGKISGKAKKLVIDGDGLKSIKNNIPEDSIITPHEGEFRYLFGVNGTRDNIIAKAKQHRCVILKKDPSGDIISDGKKVKINKMHNPGMTKGGTGDVLSGLVAALACKNNSFEAAAAGAYINGYAAELLRKQVGFNFCASDLAEKLGEACFRLRNFE